MQKSPFKFLDSYSKEDRDVFFGRDNEIEELHARVLQSKILVLYGVSGTGKSSLINCGLANKFNDSDWLPVNVRRGLNINKSLNEGLLKNALTKNISDADSKPDIIKLIRSIYLDHFKPVFLIFDQFEEMFIFAGKSEKDEFISTIKKVIDSDLQCRFIFSVREEYLACFTEFERTIPTFLSNRIRIEKMTRQNALRVIGGPCEIRGIEVDPDFSNSILEKLNPGSPDVELTYLQVYLDKIYRLASGKGEEVRKITNDFIDKVGDVKDLLGSFLEEQISRLDDPDTGLIILKSFVSVKGTRNQITEDEVIEFSRTFGNDIDVKDVRNLIQKFISLRILRDKDENSRYELRHDSLASRIYEKITLLEKELLEIRHFIENSWRTFERRNLYLTVEDLKYIAPYEDKLFLNEKITRFISQSKWINQSARRRRQNVLVFVAVIIIGVLSFFTVWAFKERGNALDQKQLAEEQKDAALEAKIAADSARQEAFILRNLALDKESIAILAQKQSDEARKEALSEREYALQQKNRAENLSVIANQQAQIANEERLIAELERSKAVIAEKKAWELSLLSTAQNLALKSMNIEKDPQMRGMLAVQAYTFNKDNGGQPDDPVIFEALNTAWMDLDSSRHSLFRGSDHEIQSIAENTNGLVSANLEGEVNTWNNVGVVSFSSLLNYRYPVNYISLNYSGNFVLTQHDNFEILLWKPNYQNIEVSEFQILTGHHGFIRAISFSDDDKYLATGGKDSVINIWDLQSVPATMIKSFTSGTPVLSVLFCNSDTVVFAGDDGSVYLRDLNNDRNLALYSSKTEKPISLAWNKKRSILFAGCSDGSLLLFAVEGGEFSAPLKYIGHSAGIEKMKFNSDFSLFATASRDNTIRLHFYNEYFDKGNIIGGVVRFNNLNSRIRSIYFTKENRLAAGLSDRLIHIWETSSGNLATRICNLVNRDLTVSEWNDMVGYDIPYEKCCNTNPVK